MARKSVLRLSAKAMRQDSRMGGNCVPRFSAKAMRQTKDS